MITRKLLVPVLATAFLTGISLFLSCAREEKVEKIDRLEVKIKTIYSFKFMRDAAGYRGILYCQATCRLNDFGDVVFVQRNYLSDNQVEKLSWHIRRDNDNKKTEIDEAVYVGKQPELLCRYEIKYDEDGNKLEQYEYDDSGMLTDRISYKYDNEGNNIEIARHNIGGELKSKQYLRYNNKRQLTERTWHKVDWEIHCIWKYKYNRAGNLTEWAWYVPLAEELTLVSKWRYQYNGAGLKAKETWYDSNECATGVVCFKYDDKNRLVERESYRIENGIFGGTKKIPCIKEIHNFSAIHAPKTRSESIMDDYE